MNGLMTSLVGCFLTRKINNNKQKSVKPRVSCFKFSTVIFYVILQWFGHSNLIYLNKVSLPPIGPRSLRILRRA